MKIVRLYPGGFACNCYLIQEEHDAVLIDCSAPVAEIRSALTDCGARLQAILCTHGHFDHLLTADDVRKAFDVPLFLHKDDAPMPADSAKNAFATFFGFDKIWQNAEHLFEDGDALSFGALKITVRHTPGHSRGSSIFVCDNVAFTGDTLFASGYGRTDLYGGDSEALFDSLQGLTALPQDLTIYPGHGESTTLKTALKHIF